MAIEYDRWRWVNMTVRDIESWVPVFGQWCGPGYSAGKRTKDARSSSLTDVADPVRPEKESAIDAICKEHDQLYEKAIGKVDEINKKSAADIILLRKLAALDKKTLTRQELQYCYAVQSFFNVKTFLLGILLSKQTQAIDEQTHQQIAEWVHAFIETPAKNIHSMREVFNKVSYRFLASTFPQLKKEIERIIEP